MRLLALDIGDRRIGLAVCDELEIVVTPLVVLRRDGREIEAIRQVVDEQQIELVVAGIPYNEVGSMGPQARKITAFIEQLRPRLAVPIAGWDEHLSTWEAEEMLIQAGRRRAERRRVVDKLAAAVILQSFLDDRHRR